MNRFILPLFFAAGLSACATSRDQAPEAAYMPPVFASPSAQLADNTAQHLAHFARHDPARLDAVLPELTALAQALAHEPALTAEAASSPLSHDDLPMPPEMPASRSLRHGIHLASYRLEENAVSGWQALQAAHPVLVGLQARLEARDLGERGIFLRLKAGPFDTHGEAQSACASLGEAAEYCLPVDFTGNPLAPMTAGDGE